MLALGAASRLGPRVSWRTMSVADAVGHSRLRERMSTALLILAFTIGQETIVGGQAATW
jgi:hypothetical protein